jgi:hypothetical protein
MRGTVAAVLIVACASACGTFLEAAADSSARDDAGADGAAADDASTTTGRDAALESSIDSAAFVDKRRVIFVTAVQVIGSDLQGTFADDLCNEEAAAGNATQTVKGKKFIAWLSFPGRDAVTRIAPSKLDYRRPDGLIIASNFARLIEGPLDNPISVDSTGQPWGASGSRVWTGTRENGTASSDSCNSWSDGTSSMVGTHGELTDTGPTWTNAGEEPCDSGNHLYCIEE